MPDTRTDRREYRANVSKVQGDVSKRASREICSAYEEMGKIFYFFDCKHSTFLQIEYSPIQIQNGKRRIISKYFYIYLNKVKIYIIKVNKFLNEFVYYDNNFS